MARPSKYTTALTEKVCERIAKGESLRAICGDPKMPSLPTVMRWLSDARHAEFREQYARAREAQADKLADEILQIADDSSSDIVVGEDGVERVNHEVVARSRLRVDSRKWLASKLAPKKYGEKIEVSGDQENPMQAVVKVELVALK